MNEKWIKIKDIVLQVLAVGFVLFIVFYPSSKNQSASVLQAVIQPPNELWEPVQNVPDDIYFYYPLAVGNSWEYKGWEKMWEGDGSSGEEIIKPYNHMITIKSIKKNKDNIFEIEKETCNGNNNQNNPGSCSLGRFYLVNKDVCYSRDCQELALSFPLPEDAALIDESYKDRMAIVDDRRYVNFIHKKQKNIVLGKEIDNCFLIEYKTLPDESIDTFCYGIGFVSSLYKHHGSLDDIEDKLIKINFVE